MTTLIRQKRVLIADDVGDLRLLLRMALERTGNFEVVAEASDGAQAIEQAAAFKPDVVLLDLSMPVLDGLEALPRILQAAPDTRVIVLSGFSASRMEQHALDAGAIAYFEKGDIIAVADRLLELL